MIPYVKDDASRVAALRELNLLDSPRSHNFDCITGLLSAFFDCKFSLISLVDQDRQWFLSAQGLTDSETARDVSFCSHTVATEASLAVEDALLDPRFAENPLVVGEPHIRSYLGHPLRGPSGHLLGALCVAHDEPRRFGEAERERLACFAIIVEDLIRAHAESLAKSQLNGLLWEETRALRKSNRLLKQAERVGGIGAWELNLETRSLHFSDEMYAISGLPAGVPIDTRQALSFYREGDRARVDAAIRNTATSGLPFDYEADLLIAGGTIRRIRCVGERLEGGDQQFARIVGVIQDITSAHQTNLALTRAANYDSLTGVFNRHAFDRSLKTKIKEFNVSGEKLSLVLIDLDGFKDINDAFGHVAGDLVLEEISARVIKVTNENTVLARWGGDEFALLPPLGSSPEEVCTLAEKVLAAIGSQVDLAGHKLQLSGTCGIAAYEEGMQTKELLRRADLALYDGKKRERSAVHVYHRGLEAANHARQVAIAEVRSALDDNRVLAAYQPIVSLSDGAFVGFEALMRLNTARGDRLTAGEVLPALLDPILSKEITHRMLQSVCADMRTLRAAHPGLQFVSLNVAEADLLGRGFAPKLMSALEDASIPRQLITLEITETMLLVHDNGTVRRVLKELHEAGVRIALDDFGTGFSSLSHLRDFPIDTVKIDSSFVQAMAHDRQARAIVHAVVAMAKNMGVQIVAEGVETEDQRIGLQLTGCALGQGYLFSPALDLETIRHKARSHEPTSREDMKKLA